MRVVRRIFLFQSVAVLVIFGSFLLLSINPWSAIPFTLRGGPVCRDKTPLSSARRLYSTHSDSTQSDSTQSDSNLDSIPAQNGNEKRKGNGNKTISVSSADSSRVVFVSCNRQKMFNPFLKIFPSLDPNLFIWMGDNIYADHTGKQWEVAVATTARLIYRPITTLKALFLRTEHLFPPAPTKVVKNAFEQVSSNPDYQKLKKHKTLELITGTWDDHDYGVNDGDKTYQFRDESKQYLLDFLEVPAPDPRRQASHQGVYIDQYIDVPISNFGKSTLKIGLIILDTRYNKDTWSSSQDSGDFLGAQQWNWLEETLANSDADLHLIISSIQVLVENRAFLESWGGFPVARRRLINTVIRSGASNPIFLSGDVHFSEIGSVVCHPRVQEKEKDKVKDFPGVQLWEMTSSGLTHAARRVPLGTGLYLDLVLRWLLPTNHVLDVDGVKQIYTGRNAGILDVISNGSHPIASFKIINSRAEVVLGQDLLISHKRTGRNWLSPMLASPSSDLEGLTELQWKALDWDCEPINGVVSSRRTSLGIQLVVLVAIAFGIAWFLFFALLAYLAVKLGMYYVCRLFKKQDEQKRTSRGKRD